MTDRIRGRAGKGLMTALCVAAGIMCALSFVVGADGYTGMSEPPASGTSYLWCALAICFALLFRHVYITEGLRHNAAACVLGLLFGVLNAFASRLFAYDSLSMGARELALTLARALMQSLPMTAGLVWADAALSGKLRRSPAVAELKADIKPKGQAARLFDAHPSLGWALIFIICWLPYLICFYPGTVCWDLGEMAAQFFGVYETDTWHPVFTTWLFGGCVWLGRLVGSDNLGVFLFTLVQTALLAYALSRSLGFMRALGLGRGLRLTAAAFFALSPIWGGYAQFVSKDTLYTAAMLLFTLAVMEALLSRERGEAASRRCAIELFAWGLLSSLLRSNGLYVVLPTALMLVLCGARGKARLWLCAALGGAVACALLFSNVLLPSLGVRDETASGIYSVCFQQSARILRDHWDEITPEEYAETDAVLDAKNLPDLYEPWISDPVKFTFRQYGTGAEAEKQALARYRGTWLEMLKKYPLTSFEAFFAGNMSYYTFMPKLEGNTYNNQAGNRFVFETYELGDSRGDDPRFVDTTQIPMLERARTLLAAYSRGWRHIPLLSLTLCCAAYVWALVACGASLLRRRCFLRLIGFLPALLTLGVCMLSPVNDYFRYILPLVAMTPPLIGFACKAPKANEN